ncbi:hypothetical protein M427DRAFT_54398 [Gonapodya prolifera JEL478]|uniref:Uncharacterized protein n=1 Tax=Gonapodya prolifera (strain JEL478) TaxID=1344416 RepID=A0A139AM14_GONPJ|nr:hypothetical protein M427DRAFT_54398 [Gonapodya prolifera JEL478]|eukprot:KXS17817.1 hypothetical protein M427DRAFT_54398 [Gonapodya prolifera JEL478]
MGVWTLIVEREIERASVRQRERERREETERMEELSHDKAANGVLTRDERRGLDVLQRKNEIGREGGPVRGMDDHRSRSASAIGGLVVIAKRRIVGRESAERLWGGAV